MVNLRMARILVTGASGPIGQALLPTLSANGAHITRLVRNESSPSAASHSIRWDPNQPFAADVLSGFDAVIHLAGETIVGRWSDTKKKKIRDSRVIGTENLSQALADAKDKPQVYDAAIANLLDRKSTRLNSSHTVISYAVFCLKKKK